MKKINSFRGEYRWLSNFWPCKIVDRHGREYASVEHAYQSCKVASTADAERIRNAATPAEAKRLSRTLPQRSNWSSVKVDVMRKLLARKFQPGSELGGRLLSTGDCELIEGNTWGDRFWGVCNGQGKNWLGKLLMEARQALREE